MRHLKSLGEALTRDGTVLKLAHRDDEYVMPDILDRIARGEQFLITKLGRPAAQLGPVWGRGIVWHEDVPTLKS